MSELIVAQPFVPPPYPYDRLAELVSLAARLEGGAIDLSVGTPCDPPPDVVFAAMGAPGSEHGYPASVGSLGYRQAALDWLRRRFDVEVDLSQIASCVGTKEFVTGVPHLLRLRRPDLDTVLYPAVSYPSYAMGATLAGCRAVPVPIDGSWQLDLSAIAENDAERALCLWVNTPGNPTGVIDDLSQAAEWGRSRGIPVFSDECYAEFTWRGAPRTVLSEGTRGVVAVHSLSKRSNLAGVRAGFFAGDDDLVHYLSEVRKHQGLMVPGPAQLGAAAAWGDDAHVEVQRHRYLERLQLLVKSLGHLGIEARLPDGAFYLWVAAPDGDAWALARRLAESVGVVVSPGEFYGEPGARHVRIAAVQPIERLGRIAERIGSRP